MVPMAAAVVLVASITWLTAGVLMNNFIKYIYRIAPFHPTHLFEIFIW
jgi:hypothetical protein